MSDPIVTPDDLAVYIGAPIADEDRATMLLADAQALCESIVSPLPAAAAAIIRRITRRAMDNPSSAHSMQLDTAHISFAGGSSQYGIGGLYLSKSDKADLRRLNGGGSAFNINLLPPDYAMNVEPWDFNGITETPSTS